jgi:hypothetical protein
MVPGDDEQAILAEMETVEETVKEIGDPGVLLREAPVRGVAGETDQVDRAVLDENLQILLPTVAENPAPTPRLALTRSPLVEIGQVKDAQPVAWLVQETSGIGTVRLQFSAFIGPEPEG